MNGKKISFTLNLKSKEQLDLINKWLALINPSLFALDICVVAAMKLDSEALRKEPKKAKLVEQLKNLDKTENTFSYFIALMEKVSDSRDLLLIEELKEQLIIDINTMRSFFTNATVEESDKFILEFAEAIFKSPIESDRTNYLDFIKALNNCFKLYNTISRNKRLSVAQEIVSKAKSLSVSPQHPVVILALACLYGNQSAKKIMKFKANPEKFECDNAYADIAIMQRVSKLENLLHKANKKYKVELLSGDEALNTISKLLTYKTKPLHSDENGSTSEISITFKTMQLLTEAGEEECRKIENLLIS